MRKMLLLLSKQDLLRKIWFGFPEGILKDQLRALGLRLVKTFPTELTLRKGETVVQVGSTPEPEDEEGGEVLTMAQIVGKSGRVIAIEPEERNIAGLRKKLEEKSLKNVTLIPKGAWSRKGKLRFLLSPHALDHRIEMPEVLHDNDLRPGNYQGFTEIEVDTIDNVLRDLGIDKVDYVKITVNGAELEVLKGMEETLKQDLRLWVKGHAIKDGHPINSDIVSLLENKGFIAQIIGGGIAPISKDFVRAGDVYAERPKIHNKKYA